VYTDNDTFVTWYINTLNGELYPICNLLSLFRAHHILHVSRVRVNIDEFAEVTGQLWSKMSYNSALHNFYGTNSLYKVKVRLGWVGLG